MMPPLAVATRAMYEQHTAAVRRARHASRARTCVVCGRWRDGDGVGACKRSLCRAVVARWNSAPASLRRPPNGAVGTAGEDTTPRRAPAVPLMPAAAGPVPPPPAAAAPAP